MPDTPEEQQVVLVGTGEPLYQVLTRREYIETIENLVDSIDLDILVINAAGIVIVWNSSLARKECPKERAIGLPFWEVMPQFLEEYHGYRLGETILQEVIERGKTIEISRYPQRLISGKSVISDFKASPLRGRGGAILGAVLVINDITEQIKLEQQLIRHARTTSLANLGASLAHEIRNPLNSIQLNIELIREGLERLGGPDREGLAATAGLVLEEARRLNGLVTHFLEFARPPEPKLALESPAEAIEFALKLLAEEAKRRSIEVVTDLPELPRLRLDRSQMSQAVYNIALNAIQAMSRGGKLTVRARAYPDYVRIDVADTGPGIPPDGLDKLFDLFYTRREGGTGLGLPIAHRIVENHDGKLVAANAEGGGGGGGGGGAVFSIYLPVP